MVAGGTFNGDLYIWDLSLEGDVQRAKSDALTDLRHRCGGGWRCRPQAQVWRWAEGVKV